MGLVVLTPSACLENVFYPSFISEGQLCKTEYSGWQLFSFNTSNILSNSILTCKVCAEKSAAGLMWAALRSLSLVCIFWQFNYNESWCGSCIILLIWNSLGSWIWMSFSFLKLGKFSDPFILSLLLWDISNVNICQPESILKSLRPFLVFFLFALLVDGFCCPVFDGFSLSLLVNPSHGVLSSIVVLFHFMVSIGNRLTFSLCWSSHLTCSVLQTLTSIFRTIVLNSLSGKSLLSISLMSFWCSILFSDWNIAHFIFLDIVLVSMHWIKCLLSQSWSGLKFL